MNYNCDTSRFLKCTESKLRNILFSFLASKVLPTVPALRSKMIMPPFYIKISMILPNKISITNMVNIIKTLNNFQKGANQKMISNQIFLLLSKIEPNISKLAVNVSKLSSKFIFRLLMILGAIS
uniref:Uncharacterized protein n=1 Tax=Micrurus lemniscatus lemniscatus TaxID=129467 RepID=A0A2D4J4U0_MICLE